MSFFKGIPIIQTIPKSFHLHCRRFSRQHTFKNVADDTEVIFRNTTTNKLLRGMFIFQFCRFRSLVHSSCDFILYILSNTSQNIFKRFLTPSLLSILRSTVSPQFVGGETLSECLGVCNDLKYHGTRCIFDESIEENTTTHSFNETLQSKIRLLKSISESVGKDTGHMIPLKVTSLISPQVLENLTSAINISEKQQKDRMSLDEKEVILDQTDTREFEEAMMRFKTLCQVAEENQISILFDAEQSNRQPAINYITRLLGVIYNKKKPIIFNTYQMYLKSGRMTLENELRIAEAGGWCIGAKIVRGACMFLFF